MNTYLKSALAVACLIVGVSSAGSVSAGAACMSSCNDRNSTCTASGRSESACLSDWHQCKVACAPGKAPAKAHVSPVPTAHVIKASTHA